MRVYLDSCILIYRLEGIPEFADPVVEAIRAATATIFCMSDLVRLECLVGPIRQNDADRKATFEAQFRQLTRLALRKAAFDLAAELRPAARCARLESMAYAADVPS